MAEAPLYNNTRLLCCINALTFDDTVVSPIKNAFHSIHVPFKRRFVLLYFFISNCGIISVFAPSNHQRSATPFPLFVGHAATIYSGAHTHRHSHTLFLSSSLFPHSFFPHKHPTQRGTMSLCDVCIVLQCFVFHRHRASLSLLRRLSVRLRPSRHTGSAKQRARPSRGSHVF